MYEIFLQLLQKYGITPYQVSKETGVTQTALSNWKNKKSTPSPQNLQKIANFFGVSIEYLLLGVEDKKEPKITPKDERDIGKRLEDTLAELENSQETLMFSGEPLDDETKELLKASLENSIRIAKINAKAKFTPKKYRTEE